MHVAVAEKLFSIGNDQVSILRWKCLISAGGFFDQEYLTKCWIGYCWMLLFKKITIAEMTRTQVDKQKVIFPVFWQVTLPVISRTYVQHDFDDQIRCPAVKKFYGQPTYFCCQNVRTVDDFNHHKCLFCLSLSSVRRYSVAFSLRLFHVLFNWADICWFSVVNFIIL